MLFYAGRVPSELGGLGLLKILSRLELDGPAAGSGTDAEAARGARSKEDQRGPGSRSRGRAGLGPRPRKSPKSGDSRSP